MNKTNKALKCAWEQRRLADLAEALPDLAAQLGDIEAEYYGECARFGDAGPGAGLRLRQCQAHQHALEAEYARLERRYRLHDAHVRASWNVQFEDLPF